MSKEHHTEIEVYLTLCSMHVLYRFLPNEGQEKFIQSLNNNPIRLITKDSSFVFSSIINFHSYKNYFIYKPLYNHDKVYFVEKEDVPKALKNVVQLAKNGFKTFHSHRLN